MIGRLTCRGLGHGTARTETKGRPVLTAGLASRRRKDAGGRDLLGGHRLLSDLEERLLRGYLVLPIGYILDTYGSEQSTSLGDTLLQPGPLHVSEL